MAQADSYPATGNGARAQAMAQARQGRTQAKAQDGASQAKPSKAHARAQGASRAHKKGHAIYGVAFACLFALRYAKSAEITPNKTPKTPKTTNATVQIRSVFFMRFPPRRKKERN